MKDLPNWVKVALRVENLKCRGCDYVYKQRDVIAMGIRTSLNDNTKESLYFELLCKECDELVVYEMQNLSLKEFALDILDDSKKMKMKKPSTEEQKLLDYAGSLQEKECGKTNYHRKSKITKKEIKAIVQFLNKCKYHNDVLEAMGMSPEEIDQYSYVKKDKK
jgi:hypothetical protein